MKRHYLALDGLRGVAAVCVAILHINVRMVGTAALPRAYLAVDFFFVLSGFVVAYAYERRLLDSMAFSSFVKIRLVRLMPMIFVATLIGALYVLIRNHLEPAHAKSLGILRRPSCLG